MAGVCRHTGKVISNLESATQGVELIMITALYSRLVLRHFGGGAVEVLGKLVTPKLFLLYRQLVATAIDVWEKRFKVRDIFINGTTDEFIQGKIGLIIRVEYRPGAYNDPPDYTIDSRQEFQLFVQGSQVITTKPNEI